MQVAFVFRGKRIRISGLLHSQPFSQAPYSDHIHYKTRTHCMYWLFNSHVFHRLRENMFDWLCFSEKNRNININLIQCSVRGLPKIVRSTNRCTGQWQLALLQRASDRRRNKQIQREEDKGQNAFSSAAKRFVVCPKVVSVQREPWGYIYISRVHTISGKFEEVSLSENPSNDLRPL